MDIDNIVLDEETILNNIKSMYNGGNWEDILIYYCNLTKLVRQYFVSVCDAAALNGHLEVLKYAHANGCSWYGLTCAYAAPNGHLDVLYYLYENEAPYGGPIWIHPNCKDFFDTFGEYWKKGDFSLMHNLKPAKN